MDNSATVNALGKFLFGSKTFIGVCFRGCYAIDTEIFLLAFREYLESGNNYLDEHTMAFNLYETILRNSHELTPEDIDQYRGILNNEGFWDINDFYVKDKIKEMDDSLKLREAEIITRKRFLKTTDYRNTIEYKKWRESVFKRDNYTCQECGKKGGKLQAHHIYPFKKYAAKRYEVGNGKTLCITCHRKKHKK